MFDIAKVSDNYLWPVKFDIADEKGKPKEISFMAEFTRLPQSRIDEVHEEVRQAALASMATDDEEGLITDADLVEEVLVGWRKVMSDGEALVFDDENKALVLAISGCRFAIVKSWYASLEAAPVKNSKGSRAAGQ